MHSGVIRPELVRPQATPASNVYKLDKPKQVIIQPQNITLGIYFQFPHYGKLFMMSNFYFFPPQFLQLQNPITRPYTTSSPSQTPTRRQP